MARTGMTATRVQTAAVVVSAVLLPVGGPGFIPGISTGFHTMGVAGHEAEAMLFGIFQVSVLHNIVHLLFGIVGLAAARTASGATYYLIVGGIVYLVLWIYGLIIDLDDDANFVPFNDADNWLHLVLGIGMVALGFVLGRSAGTRTRSTPLT